MARTLFQIGDDLVALDNLLDEIEGDLSRAPEIEPAVVAWFDSLANDEALKLDGYCNLLRQLDGEVAVAKAEAEQYQMKARTRENRIKFLKGRLQQHLERTKRTKVQTATGRTIAIQTNGGNPPVVLDPGLTPDLLPEQFVKVVRTIDTDAIRDELKAGGEVPGARLGDRGTHLRIK